IKLSKCEFFKDEIEFVGHTVNPDGVSPSKTYIRDILQLKKPRTKAELGRYLGMVGWIAKYIFQIRGNLAPIMKLNKKNALMSDWDDKCDRAFYKVQTLLNNADILKHPEMGKPFYIWTDASVKGMGAVLMQKDTDGKYKPIEFYSKAFSGSEINWHITTKELFVVVKAIEKWNHYL
ncbi:MAG: hypothetical protein GY928_12785, partial [Colwellia sp.]|nr:hypothetical protein [Colwellia sp.]